MGIFVIRLILILAGLIRHKECCKTKKHKSDIIDLIETTDSIIANNIMSVYGFNEHKQHKKFYLCNPVDRKSNKIIGDILCNHLVSIFGAQKFCRTKCSKFDTIVNGIHVKMNMVVCNYQLLESEDSTEHFYDALQSSSSDDEMLQFDENNDVFDAYISNTGPADEWYYFFTKNLFDSSLILAGTVHKKLMEEDLHLTLKPHATENSEAADDMFGIFGQASNSYDICSRNLTELCTKALKTDYISNKYNYSIKKKSNNGRIIFPTCMRKKIARLIVKKRSGKPVKTKSKRWMILCRNYVNASQIYLFTLLIGPTDHLYYVGELMKNECAVRIKACINLN